MQISDTVEMAHTGSPAKPGNASAFRYMLAALLLAGSFLLHSCNNGNSGGSGSGEQASGGSASGFNEELIPTEEELRAEFLAIAETYSTSRSPYLGFGMVDFYSDIANNAEIPEAKQMQARLELARQLLKDGDVDEALVEVNRVDEWLSSVDPQMVFADPMEMQFALTNIYWMKALAWMRKAEVENCITRNNKDCCIFPLSGGGVHDVDEPARKAMEGYMQYLEVNPRHKGAIWLLNLAAMAADIWPEGVDERYRLPEDSFTDETSIPRFPNIAGRLGIDTFNLCGGTIVDDFNGDGYYDIVTSSYDFAVGLHYYVSDGEGGFTDRSKESGLSVQKGGLNCVGTDYNNDGHLDILVLRGAWLRDDGLIRNSLIRNNGDGTFSDVTAAVGMTLPGRPGQAACWHDFNNDGWLDLYVGIESRVEIEDDGPSYPARLWVSNGDGSFTERAAEAGCDNEGYAKGVTAGDYDNDGLVDIYVSNVGRNRLYHNRGDLRFEEISSETGVFEPAERSFAPWFFDYDNDGNLDIFVSAYDASIEDLTDLANGRRLQCSFPRIYHNEGDGSFLPRTHAMGLDLPFLPMGANFGDIDNDGWLDMYLATGDPEFETLMPNVMLHNLGGTGFEDCTYSGGFGHLQKGHGVGFADIDNDGDQDIYNQLGGFYPGDKFANALFHNPGNANKWLKVRLEGVETNRQGYGVRIRVDLATPSGERQIHRAAGSVSSFGGSPRTQEIGLGDATAISMLELYWPVSGTRQQFTDVPLNTTILVREDGDSWEDVSLPPLQFPVAE